MREAGLVVASIHESLRSAVRPGVCTRELDQVSAQAIAEGGAKSNFQGYFGYPATVCISVNDVIVHGIPGEAELAPGDIVSFDCGAYVEHRGRQWHGDAAFSVIVGEPFISDTDFSAGERATAPIPGWMRTSCVNGVSLTHSRENPCGLPWPAWRRANGSARSVRRSSESSRRTP